jgi:hypothetical protein
VDAATFGVIAGLLGTGVSAVVAVRQNRADAKLEETKSELEAKMHERTTMFDREVEAADVLARYREPLAAAAFDLQSRLYNILCKDFLALYADDPVRSEEAVTTTLFRLAQYFGWTEILRRDIQFLAFPEADDTRKVAHLQSQISKCFLTHVSGRAMMIWSDEQRALGELMIVEEHGKVLCMGYANFRGQCAGPFAPWVERLRGELRDPAASARLHDAQHALCELVETLDADRVRYTEDLERATAPLK